MILNTIGKKNGIYVYRLKNEILYIGKGNPIYGRIKSHYEECHRQPKGDRTGRWHKFFSQHIGAMEVQWRVVDDQGVQLFVESAMTEHFKPKFVTFKG
jgi:excinuclease UvrABC nuclease subunit